MGIDRKSGRLRGGFFGLVGDGCVVLREWDYHAEELLLAAR